MVVQNPLDRVPGDVVAEIRERATDARVPPRWILDRHPHHEVGHLAWRYRPASTSVGAAVVLPGDQPPVPAENRVRRDDAGDLRQHPPAEFLASHRESTALGVGQAKWTWATLLPENQILLPKIIDHVFLVAVHPASGREYEEAQSVGHSLRLLGKQPLAPTLFRRFANLGRFVAPYGVAWRAADSLSVRSFLGLELHEAPPDHSTVSRTRRLIDLETHQAVFTWVLQRLADANLVTGKTIGIDATTLEANAALRSIVRRDTGEAYPDFLTTLAHTSGIETPTRADLARLDRKRPKKGSNADWRHPHDPDARITKLKDGRTHLAHKAEHAVDLDTGAVVGVTVQDADTGDAETSQATLTTAAETIETVVPDGDGLQEVVGDKGYHSNQELIDLEAVGIRSYISEPDRGRRNWTGKAEARAAVYRNRRRIHGARGQRLLRLRGERLERPFAHLYETGGLRRVYLRGHANILKRVLIHAGGLNLGLLMRHLIGVGTPRSLQGRAVACVRGLWSLVRLPETLWKTIWMRVRPIISLVNLHLSRRSALADLSVASAFTTDC